MCGLKVCLWIAAVGCLVSSVGVFAPVSAWDKVANVFGVESIPDAPVCEYMVRVMLATYALIGVFLAILAIKPMAYGIMVPFTAISSIVLGAVCMAVGIMACMPTQWFLGDSLPCLIIGALILVFWKKANQPSIEIPDMETTDTED